MKGYKRMSFTGGSISQAAQISGADTRLTAVEVLAASKVAQSVYDAKVALVDAKDAEQDGRLLAAESKNVEQDGRLSAVEGRATALETDVAGRVQAAIDEKVATVVFDALASELRSADSALTAALATKVAATTQSAVDALQNSNIATKASIAQLNNVINAFNSELDRLDGVDATKVAIADYNAKVDALEEFINVLLQTYTITKPSGGAYAYTGVKQNLLAAPFAPENPSNVVVSGNTIAFDLPATIAQLDFVDISVAGAWSHILRSSLTIVGSRVTATLPSAIAGEVLIFSRYDAFSGNSNAGFYRIVV